MGCRCVCGGTRCATRVVARASRIGCSTTAAGPPLATSLVLACQSLRHTATPRYPSENIESGACAGRVRGRDIRCFSASTAWRMTSDSSASTGITHGAHETTCDAGNSSRRINRLTLVGLMPSRRAANRTIQDEVAKPSSLCWARAWKTSNDAPSPCVAPFARRKWIARFAFGSIG